MTDAELSKALEVEAEHDQLRFEVKKLQGVLIAFAAWQRTASLSREAHHAATRVCNSLRMCTEYPDRESFVRLLGDDVARLDAALTAHSSKRLQAIEIGCTWD